MYILQYDHCRVGPLKDEGNFCLFGTLCSTLAAKVKILFSNVLSALLK